MPIIDPLDDPAFFDSLPARAATPRARGGQGVPTRAIADPMDDPAFIESLNMPTGEAGNPLPGTRGLASPTGGGGISTDPQYGAGFLTALRAGLAPDIQDQIKRFAASRGIPSERYGVDPEGRIFYSDPETGELAYEVPPTGSGVGLLDRFMRFGDEFALATPAYAPQVVGGIVGSLAGGPVAGVPMAGATAAVTDLARQGLDRLMANESPLNLDYANAGWQAAGAMAGEGAGRLLGAGASRAYNRNPGQLKRPDVETVFADPSRSTVANRVSQYADDQGSFVTLGEASDLGGQLSRERFLRTTDEGAGLRNMIRDRNTADVPRIANQTINPRSSADTAITNLRNEANALMKRLRDSRSEQASPLYEEAFAANPSMASPEISRILDTPAGKKALQEAAELIQNERGLIGIPDAELGALSRELAELGMMEKPSGGVASGLKMSALDYIKQTLWDLGERAAANPQQGARVAAAYKKLAYDLKTELDRLDVTKMVGPRAQRPEGGLYAQARKVYGDESSAVTESERLLERFAGNEGAPLAKSLDTFLLQARTTPEETARVRGLFALTGKLQAWDDATRVWLADKFADAVKAAGDSGNIAAKFERAMWGDVRQREIIEAALGGQTAAGPQIDALGNMFEFFRAVGRQLPEGSSTGSNIAEAKSIATLAGRVQMAIAKILSPQTWGTEIGGALSSAAQRNAYKRLVQVALTPENSRALQNLRLIGPKWERGIPIVGKILTQAGLMPTARGLAAPGPMLPSQTGTAQ